MTGPTWRAPSPASGPQAPGEAAFRPWRRLRELGRGNMGAVWEVAHEETGERLALKVLLVSREHVTADDLGRFRREAELAARLDHPHLARVHAWQLEPWPPWMVMDLFPGGSLADRLSRGPLPPEEARRIAVALADGMAHAHELGILHRDLKPGNVMFDGQGRPLVTDFGLARGALGATQGLTRTGEVLGTPVYMAPEQARDAKHVDARSDVYGLGAILYAMLTGQPPIQGVSNLIEALEAVITRAPLLPSRLAPGIPPALEDVCLRALAKDPADRPQSAAELRDALIAVGPQTARPVARSRRGLLLAGLGVLACGLVAGGLLALRPAPAPSPDPQPVEPAPPPPPSGPLGPWTVVHTHGWRLGGQQVWLSLVLGVEAPEGAAGARVLRFLRARVVYAGERRGLEWDSNPSGRRVGSMDGDGPAALDRLRTRPLVLPGEGGAPDPEALAAWRDALRAVTEELEHLVPGVAGAWDERFRPERLRQLVCGWDQLAAAREGQAPSHGSAARGVPGEPPLWAVWDPAGNAPEALARVEMVRAMDVVRPAQEAQAQPGGEPSPPEPIDDLAGARGLLRGYLTALNACALLYWSPAPEDVLLVPDARTFPGVEDLSRPVALWAEDLPLPGQVGRTGSAVAHAWPWGPPLSPLPPEGRYVRLAAHGEWVAIAWGGGVAYVPARDVGPAHGPLGRVTTRRTAAMVVVPEDVVTRVGRGNDMGRQEKGTLVPTLGLRQDGWVVVWFDARPGLISREYGKPPDRYEMFQLVEGR